MVTSADRTPVGGGSGFSPRPREGPLVHHWEESVPRPLRPREIHVWSSDLDRDDDEVRSLADSLSTEERSRASRFRFDRDQRRYIVGRSTLRAILGTYLGQPASSLEIVTDGHGKPALRGGVLAGGGALRFNVTHSDRLALFAVTTGAEIGIDVEHVEALPDADSIAEGYFSAVERADLRGLAASEKPAGFYRCWTRKEAYLKAIGLGLAAPLDAFAVTLTADAPPRFLHIEGDAQAAGRWALHSLEPAVGYQGALAIESPGMAIRTARWPSGVQRLG